MPTIKIKDQEVEIDYYREQITVDKCIVSGAKATYVSIDDEDEVISNQVRLEMTPGKRLRYIKIEEVPYENPPRSAAEVAFNGPDDDDDPEIDDDDYVLTDDDLPPNAGSAS